jgi:putative protease
MEPPAKAVVEPTPQSVSREQRIGDVVHIHGHTTDFTQKVESLEVDRAPVSEVGPNDDFGLKVIEHAREHDTVSKLRS